MERHEAAPNMVPESHFAPNPTLVGGTRLVSRVLLSLSARFLPP